jgi:hypothetical protein
MRVRDEIDSLSGLEESRSNAICAATGLTVRDVARRYRVGEDKVRAWIKIGELVAINTAATLCGKPRYVVTVEALQRFEARRAVCPPPKPKWRRRQSDVKDYYPD